MKRLILGLLLALLLLGAGPASFDWGEDAKWELVQGQRSFRLGLTLEDFGEPPSDQEMVVLPVGLLVRRQSSRVVNLTVLQGEWKLCRNQQALGQVGDALSSWQSQVGLPRARYGSPEKRGVIHYYQASLADIGLMVAEDKVQSVMLVEPGYLLPALERTGYSILP